MDLGILVSRTPINSSHPGPLLAGTIHTPLLSIPLSVLVDSGADDNLIDGALAHQLLLPLTPLKPPVVATALDRRLITNMTPSTAPISLVMAGNHHEKIVFKSLNPLRPLLCLVILA